MPTNGPVGERIAIYRRRRGLSQVVLAGLIGRSVSWLSQVERGTRAVDRMSVLIDLSRMLKVDIAELTGQPFALAPNGGLEPEGLADIRRVLMRYTELPAAINPGPGAVTTASGLTRLRSRVDIRPGGSGRPPATPSSGTRSPTSSPRRSRQPSTTGAMTSAQRSRSWPRPTR
jgi:transcriptional regulator with XRE-family HTH domain